MGNHNLFTLPDGLASTAKNKDNDPIYMNVFISFIMQSTLYIFLHHAKGYEFFYKTMNLVLYINFTIKMKQGSKHNKLSHIRTPM
jgi:hypothetical protein